ncbi:AI-2E family transporter [Luteolibacter sp. SL250]|uniref:AI-2E family transporter n=1 Tax=Luteolibacter sp. SL250 TaxID=2995170 RepID=UPI00226FB6BF|nr:AI-2E family transporter [Luteolibacter sp. SL250]WAC18425.1 AI-2E family transporter [Luteolibacter sp. SL250]
METPRPKSSSQDAINGLWTIGLCSFVIAALYFGRDILTPIALAALLTFLLSPLVTRLQRYVGRICAVLLVVFMMLGLTIGSGWVLTRQIVDLGTKLPDYKENIRMKIKAFQLPSGGAFSKLSETFDDLKKDLPIGNGEIGDKTDEGIRKLESQESGEAIPVEVVSTPDASPLELFKLIVAPVVGPLGTAALVLLLMVFMLLQRDDLRNRIIRLIGQGRISATTSAMDDAAARVSRYLFMQLVVNVTYGMGVALGLWIIGVPNAILWGTFATVLRFVPYVGPWIAAAFPIILSIAVSPDWWMPVKAIGLFVVLELVSNNVMEPWLYGSSTGVSSIALIVAAVFWTYLWGPVGLVMATPITVCIAVMGRHIPQLAFLNVILSDEDALTPAEDCYHRLLRAGGDDELELAESYLKTHTLTDFYDSMLIPALVAAGKDQNRGVLDRDQISQVEHAIGELLEELDDRLPGIAKIPESLPDHVSSLVGPCRIHCVPAKAERDRLSAEMLAQLLRVQKFEVTVSPPQLTASEKLERIRQEDPDVICISVTEPTSPSQARYLCMKFRAAFPKRKIAIGLWDMASVPAETEKALREAGADLIMKGVADTQIAVMRLSSAISREMQPAPIPPDDEKRVQALELSGAMKTQDDFTVVTDKLTRIFEAPIAILSLIDKDTQHFKAQSGLPDELGAEGGSPRETSVCGHVVAADEFVVIEDLARDRRFAGNTFVKKNGFRFYAGAPVHSPDGHAIGSLCLIDTHPRDFTQRERKLLEEYAAEVSDDIRRATDAI